MTNMKATYRGDLRVHCSHESGAVLDTDAPKDNHGKGENFSPTDLIPVALASCMLTLMGIAARKLGVDLPEATIDVTKEMTGSPRRIGRIALRFRSSLTPSPEVRAKLEQAAVTCPVHYSLHPDIVLDIDFAWGDS